ncbi:Membrane transport protein [Sesbania bispinosa]|nr:Membrane transport protein [Sesbania bispinosa]
MIKGKDIYDVLAALVPLYVAMTLAYCSFRWWKIFTPDQCSGINRFVAVFAVPVLSFHYISNNDPYAMNFKLIVADSLQKVVILGVLFLWNTFTKYGSLDWTITLFSLSTLPNTLLVGVPLLTAMYGDFTASLVIQIVVFQSVIWYNLLLFLLEYRGAKSLISQKFPETSGVHCLLRVDSDVGSLSGRVPLQADTEMGEDGKLHVVVRNSVSSSSASSFNKSHSTPRGSILLGLRSIQSHHPREPALRASSFNQTDYYKGIGFEDKMLRNQERRSWRSKSCADEHFNGHLQTSIPSKSVDFPQESVALKAVHELIDMSPSPKASGDREHEIEDGIKCPLSKCQNDVDSKEGITNKKQQMPQASVMTRLILIMVWRRLIRNPNTYASLLGLSWSLISFRWNIKLPSIINGSISIISNTGLGMAMFSLAVMAATSIAIGMRGVLLRVAIVQAAISQGIVPLYSPKSTISMQIYLALRLSLEWQLRCLLRVRVFLRRKKTTSLRSTKKPKVQEESKEVIMSMETQVVAETSTVVPETPVETIVWRLLLPLPKTKLRWRTLAQKLMQQMIDSDSDEASSTEGEDEKTSTGDPLCPDVQISGEEYRNACKQWKEVGPEMAAKLFPWEDELRRVAVDQSAWPSHGTRQPLSLPRNDEGPTGKSPCKTMMPGRKDKRLDDDHAKDTFGPWMECSPQKLMNEDGVSRYRALSTNEPDVKVLPHGGESTPAVVGPKS